MLFEKQKQARERFCCMKGIMTLLKKKGLKRIWELFNVFFLKMAISETHQQLKHLDKI